MRTALTTLLFDLDGTLLDVDMPSFLEEFFPLAARRFGPPGENRRVSQAMIAAAWEMFASRDPGRTLDRVFLEAFAPAAGVAVEEARERFAAFYRDDFEQLRPLTRPFPAARLLLEKAVGLGYELVIATNPVFFLEAIRARIRWAGLAGITFRLVTGAEIMCFAKPHEGYFTQTLALLGRRAEECLMIGNDPRMDIAAAGRVGIGTWLVTGEDGESPAAPGAERSGTLEEFAAWLEGGGVQRRNKGDRVVGGFP